MKRRKQISNRRSHSHRRLKNLSRKKSKPRSTKKRTAGNIIFGLGSQGYTNAPSPTRKNLRNYMKFNKGRAAFKKKTKEHIENLKNTLTSNENLTLEKLPSTIRRKRTPTKSPRRSSNKWLPATLLAASLV